MDKRSCVPISGEIEEIGRLVVDAAYKVRTELGPGLLKKVYEICSCHELSKRGLTCQRQVSIPTVYNGLEFDEGLRLDVF